MKSTASFLRLGSLVALLPAIAAAAQLAPVSYIFSPGAGYEDSGSELTDGITYSLAWGAGPIDYADVVNLVGWQASPTITFTFAAPVTITSVSIFLADSNGAAGVGMPSNVIFSDGAGFSQDFPVIDPVGGGQTVETTFDGFEVTTSTFSVTVFRIQEWVMLSEVQFFNAAAIPEPASAASFAGAAALALLAARRRAR